MKLCDKAELGKIVPESELQFYPNSLCFEDKSKIKLKNSWNEEHFENLYIAVDFCNPMTFNGTCKSHEEIRQFLGENIFSFLNQKTLVNKKIYSVHDTDKVYQGDHQSDYYPL